jgi:hypothetical protein
MTLHIVFSNSSPLNSMMLCIGSRMRCALNISMFSFCSNRNSKFHFSNTTARLFGRCVHPRHPQTFARREQRSYRRHLSCPKSCSLPKPDLPSTSAMSPYIPAAECALSAISHGLGDSRKLDARPRCSAERALGLEHRTGMD